MFIFLQSENNYKTYNQKKENKMETTNVVNSMPRIGDKAPSFKAVTT